MPTQDIQGANTPVTPHMHQLFPPPLIQTLPPVWAASADLAEINEACAASSLILQLFSFNNPHKNRNIVHLGQLRP